MVSSMKYVLAVAIIASIACSAFAIHCYQCESLSNPKCGEKFDGDDSMKFDCARLSPPRFLSSFFRNATGCMKKTLSSSIGGQPQVVRSCYFGDLSNTQSGCQSDPSLPFVSQLSCDVCSKDLCNSSTAHGPVAVVALMAFYALARIFA